MCEECDECYWLTLTVGEMVCIDDIYYNGCHGDFAACKAEPEWENPCEWWWAIGVCDLDISCGSGLPGLPGEWWLATLDDAYGYESCSWVRAPAGEGDCPDGVYAFYAGDCDVCPEYIQIYSIP